MVLSVDQLVVAVASHPVLYDLTMKEFHMTDIKELAWLQVSAVAKALG